MKRRMDDITQAQLTAALEAAAAQLERQQAYLDSTKEELYALAERGDDEAAAYYVRKRLNDDEMTQEDVALLERAINNLTMEAALLGGLIFDFKGGYYENRDKALFCRAIAEQDDDKQAHKELTKAAKKKELAAVYRAEERLFASLLAVYTAQSGASGLRLKVRQADRGECEFKDGYVVEVKDLRGGGAETLMTLFNRTGAKEAEFYQTAVQRLRDVCADNRLFRTARIELYAGTAQAVLGEQDFAQRAAQDELQTRRERFFGGAADSQPRKVGDANIEITVRQDKALHAAVCPQCGNPLNANNTCGFCTYAEPGNGAESANEDTAQIRITQSSAMEALVCEMCGGAVRLDDTGLRGVCVHCGTSYLLRDNALVETLRGINVGGMLADKPQDAQMPDVTFVRSALLGGKLTTVLPSDFSALSPDLKRIKYPRYAPEFVYSSPDTTVNLCFGVKYDVPFAEEDVTAAGEETLAVLKKILPQAKFGQPQKKTAGGHNVYFFDFISPAADQSVYNAMFFLSLDGVRVNGSWNCLAKDRWFYAPVFDLAVRTMEF